MPGELPTTLSSTRFRFLAASAFATWPTCILLASAAPAAEQATLTLAAASSLQSALERLDSAFTARHGIEVKAVYAAWPAPASRPPCSPATA